MKRGNEGLKRFIKSDFKSYLGDLYKNTKRAQSMEKSFGEIAEKIAKFSPKKCYLAFLDCDGNFLYSSLPKESEETLKKLTKVSSAWDTGDYQIKKFEKSNLLIYKASPRIILALESYEKEGLLIVAAKRMEENYADLFRNVEDQFLAPKAKEVSEAPSGEPSLGLAQESSLIEETEKMAESTPEEKSRLNEARKRMKRMW
nr:hypothetical protein [Candidatus Freyarchaeota archaeon]